MLRLWQQQLCMYLESPNKLTFVHSTNSDGKSYICDYLLKLDRKKYCVSPQAYLVNDVKVYVDRVKRSEWNGDVLIFDNYIQNENDRIQIDKFMSILMKDLQPKHILIFTNVLADPKEVYSVTKRFIDIFIIDDSKLIKILIDS